MIRPCGAAWIALAAGALAALGHAPFGIWPAGLAGFVLLAFAVTRSRRPALAGWMGGLGYFAVTLHWIVEPFMVDIARHGWMAPFALIFLAGGLALFWGAAGWVAGRTRPRALGWCVALAAAELARGYVFTGFPWAMPAYIWADTPVRAVAAYTGPYGLTAITLTIASLPFAMRRMALGAGVAALCLAAVWAAGWVRIEGGTEAGGTGGMVRLVQPNAPQHEKWDPARTGFFIDRLLTMTAEDAGAVDLVVWPESAIAYPLDMAGAILGRAAEAAGGNRLITGINRRTEAGEWFNSLIVVDELGAVAETFDKVHLVPFGEYIPLKIDLMRRMAGFSGFGFTKGEAVRTIETPLGRALPLICYEAIFPRHGAGAGDRPDYLLQITNDAWFGTFSGPYQHLDQARFRAAEQGLPLIRAANTGISAAIDANGEVVAALPLGQAGKLDVSLPSARAETFYARTGDAPWGVVILVTLGVLFWAQRRNAIAMRAG